MTEYTHHVTVLLDEVVNHVNYREETEHFIFGDFTFGGGGHTQEILKKNKNCKVIGVDQDSDAINNAKAKYEKYLSTESLELIHSNFSQLETKLGEQKFDGICLDLGVSNHQFKCGDRGFSFREEGPLDMRMNTSDNSIMTAADIVNEYSVDDLEEIFQTYGEERFSRRIAERICEQREESPIVLTKQLENIIFHCYPRAMRFKKAHPATKVFQALRIYVNDEMGVLKTGIPYFFSLLKPGARLAIISFHSIEDRIVKQNFVNLKDQGKILTKKPITPSKKELAANPKSRSAKLRVIQRNES